jgi:hypothetical protein
MVCFSAERAAADGRVLVAAFPPVGLAAGREVVAADFAATAGPGTREAAAGWLGLALLGPVPSTTIAAPQRLQVMRTFRPRTLSSGTAYLAGQLPHWTFMLG